MRRRIVVLALAIGSVSSDGRAQSADAGAAQDSGTDPNWSVRASAAMYVLPDEDDYVQPTVAIDRGALHLEGRYNYEARRSASGFIGWNLEFGETVTVQLTPMFGVVVGDTRGVVPALEFDLVWRRLELYSEGEYVFDINRPSNRFVYNWSEVSLWAASWLRAGMVTQRTRAHRVPPDIQRGFLVGAMLAKVEPVFYFFNPGSDDRFFVGSIGVEF
jgi:hypothetical protein